MTFEEMEKQLKILGDIEAIKCLQNEYIFYLLNGQWKEIADCFSENAYVNIWRHGKHQGRKEIFKFFTEHISKVNAGKGRDAHFTVMPVITVDGDHAKGHWMLYIFIADPVTGVVSRFLQGRYDCEYTKENGKWKFSKLIWTNPWPLTDESLPRPEEWQ
jgi:hypothetical protein